MKEFLNETGDWNLHDLNTYLKRNADAVPIMLADYLIPKKSGFVLFGPLLSLQFTTNMLLIVSKHGILMVASLGK